VVCLGPLGWMGNVLCPGTVCRSSHGLSSVVSDVRWVVGPVVVTLPLGCRSEWLWLFLWVGLLCDVAAWVGSVGVWWVHMNDTPCGVSPVAFSPQLCPAHLTSLGLGLPVKPDIHQHLVCVKSLSSTWTVHRIHRVYVEWVAKHKRSLHSPWYSYWTLIGLLRLS
jgi:hypothetical protein